VLLLGPLRWSVVSCMFSSYLVVFTDGSKGKEIIGRAGMNK